VGALFSQKAVNNQQLEFNWGAGDADVRDVALNLMGAGAGLCIIFAHRHWTAMQRLRSFILLPAGIQGLPDRILHSHPGGLIATQKGGPCTEFNQL